MIVPSKVALTRNVIGSLLSPKLQAQPCGIDLTLRRILTWKSAGTVDFSNEFRKSSKTSQLDFSGSPKQTHLDPGNYLVEFNEEVDVPLDVMGQIFVRSSLWRNGAKIDAGVVDSGYKGSLGALLQVLNPHGITLHENARLAQIVFHEMKGEVEEGYSGVYQRAKGL
ncbi:putative deoxyuridine 5'-triphosphate nucleotidohydrolase [Cercospora beticola]|uniref:Putative deoxyuridine 5'-triphosphate nucleotidohydrolase n=1 Tax=Cercospora beticola TaxID=122368 RepID=A0A2G5HM42_CERBT|nr:putative deoxyuridine 5'-triphosphate nucleotidohydrolase [Cercospora beticola]PIA93313.1 putative deoxyuridine 5'-triphosphate nucleotidohydrolase [Cercospora beticola]WPB01806.1 hypothetical protein RHO25_006438 [Cercospora beticola]CAK1363361.1 unnamed protein product [Cercospora beticola]